MHFVFTASNFRTTRNDKRGSFFVCRLQTHLARLSAGSQTFLSFQLSLLA